jgi:hypothetical protein
MAITLSQANLDQTIDRAFLLAAGGEPLASFRSRARLASWQLFERSAPRPSDPVRGTRFAP